MLDHDKMVQRQIVNKKPILGESFLGDVHKLLFEDYSHNFVEDFNDVQTELSSLFFDLGDNSICRVPSKSTILTAAKKDGWLEDEMEKLDLLMDAIAVKQTPKRTQIIHLGGKNQFQSTLTDGATMPIKWIQTSAREGKPHRVEFAETQSTQSTLSTVGVSTSSASENVVLELKKTKGVRFIFRKMSKLFKGMQEKVQETRIHFLLPKPGSFKSKLGKMKKLLKIGKGYRGGKHREEIPLLCTTLSTGEQVLSC